jgi:hypothetical protein
MTNAGSPLQWYDNTQWNTILHSGNYSDYALPLTGGTIESEDSDAFKLKRKGVAGAMAISFYNDTDGLIGIIGVGGTLSPQGKVPYYGDGVNTYPLIHSGNVAKYAVLAGVYNENDVTPAMNTVGLLNGVGAYAKFGYGSYWFELYTKAGSLHLINHHGSSDISEKTIAFTDSNVASATKLEDNTAFTAWGQTFFKNGKPTNVEGNLTIGNAEATYTTQNYIYLWKGDGTYAHRGLLGVNEGGAFYNYWKTGTSAYVELRIGENGLEYKRNQSTSALFINQSGNVTIGSQDYAGTAYQLYVNNKVGAELYYFARNKANYGYIGLASSSNNDIYISTDSTSKLWLGGNGNIIMNYYGGNVLIGTTNDNGAKLQVNGDISVSVGDYIYSIKGIQFKSASETYAYIGGNTAGQAGIYAKDAIFLRPNQTDFESPTPYGVKITQSETEINGDLHVTGNLIVEGEISGGGRAEEGGTIGGDGAEKVTATIEVGLKFKEISHTLGDNVIVQVYEWNANGQTWDMVLTDVETTTNLVTVRFGNETDVPHKVVII